MAVGCGSESLARGRKQRQIAPGEASEGRQSLENSTGIRGRICMEAEQQNLVHCLLETILSVIVCLFVCFICLLFVFDSIHSIIIIITIYCSMGSRVTLRPSLRDLSQASATRPDNRTSCLVTGQGRVGSLTILRNVSISLRYASS